MNLHSELVVIVLINWSTVSLTTLRFDKVRICFQILTFIHMIKALARSNSSKFTYFPWQYQTLDKNFKWIGLKVKDRFSWKQASGAASKESSSNESN